MPIITAVELAIVQRLRVGLGKMVKSVETYGGELDDDTEDVVRAFPAAWVTFGGVRDSKPYSTAREKWRKEALFAVMVGARSVRNEQSARHGGAGRREVGTNQLIYAVQRLLTQQDMGLPIRELEPAKVRTLRHVIVRSESFSCFAIEFHTAWIDEALPRDRFPAPDGPDHPDAIFAEHGGQLSVPDPDWLRTGLNYHLAPDDGKPDATDLIGPDKE
ncbi:Mu-like prophage protein gp37 [Cupriavidus sp. H19C3]|uniref:DUF1834 family protein n=1 Tax=Cupriavidus sp. H19C3 TaxID=3241603 RepID=UPI003BF90E0F